MKKSPLRLFIRNIINEVKEDKLPKSSGKLIDLKKELEALKKMKEELQAAKFAEKTAETEVEFANLQKFAKELDKIKAGGVALEQSIDNKIKEIEAKIDAEKNKIREMIGMIPKKGKEKIVDEGPKTDGEPDDTSMPGWMERSPKNIEGSDLEENKKPSSGVSKKDKSSLVTKARAGKDIGKKGKGFEKVAKAAGGGEKGKKIAAAQMWKQVSKK